jgi:hypothetical protein
MTCPCRSRLNTYALNAGLKPLIHAIHYPTTATSCSSILFFHHLDVASSIARTSRKATQASW